MKLILFHIYDVAETPSDLLSASNNFAFKYKTLSQAAWNLAFNLFVTNCESFMIFSATTRVFVRNLKTYEVCFLYLSNSLESRYSTVGVRSFFKGLQVDVGLRG